MAKTISFFMIASLSFGEPMIGTARSAAELGSVAWEKVGHLTVTMPEASRYLPRFIAGEQLRRRAAGFPIVIVFAPSS